MKRYDSYKDSCIAWIGEIPSHWEVIKGKFATYVLAGFAFDSDKFTPDEGYVPLIRIRDIFSNTTEMNYSGAFPLEYLIKKGDVLVGMDGDFNVARWKGNDALLNQRVCTIKETKKILSRFAFYLLPRPLQLINDICYATTVKHLSTEDIYNTILPVPPLKEQEAIADYLDRKCASIDSIIATQERRIALLNELKQSVITEVVTRGINPDAPLRDSGIDWIGQIPEHWEVTKLGHVSSVKTGTTPSTQEEKYWDEEKENWYTPGDFTDIVLTDSTRKLSKKAFDDNACNIFPPYTVFVVGIGATLGKIGYSTTTCSANQQINGIIFNKLINPIFGAFYLSGVTSVIKSLSTASTLAILNQNQTKLIDILIPPLEEQSQIIKFIDKKCASIDSAIAKAKREIELLREYKQSVITEAVTGKIKVC